MMKDNHLHPISQWTVAVLFFLLTVVALYIFVTVAEPPERKPGNKFIAGYSEQPLLTALTEQNLQASLAQLKTTSTDAKTGLLSRLSGTPGCYNTEKFITESFTQAGLRVDTQQCSVVVPVTEYCEILDENGHPLPGVKLLPFAPAGLFPTALPAQGVSGSLVMLSSTQALDLVKKPLEGNIALVKGLQTPVSWSMLAAMGTRAVMVEEDPEASAGADVAAHWNSLNTQYDLKYPRFLVQGPIEQYANKPLRIRCKVTWQTKPVRNVIGILPGKAPQGGTAAREALIITSYYDSNSVVPDLAPGAEQAVSLAAMLNLVKALAPYRGQMQRDIVFVATAGHCQTHEGVTRLLEAIERFSNKGHGEVALQAMLHANQQKLQYIEKAQQLLASPEPWKPSENTAFAANTVR